MEKFYHYLWNTTKNSSSTQPLVVRTLNREEQDILEVVNEPNLVIYPNPNKGSFNVNFSSTTSENVLLTLVDVTGRDVLTYTEFSTIGENNIPLELNNYFSGVYFLKMVIGTKVLVSKVVIE